jgi:glycosyltransferase involved in cell wall biosynthesis
MRSLRILQVLEDYSDLGGIPEVVENLAGELKLMGHQVHVVSTRHRDHEREEVRRRPDIDCTYVTLPNAKPSWSLRHLERLIREPLQARAGELARVLTRWRPDLVHSHVWRWDKYPILVNTCEVARAPLIHTMYHPAPWGEGRLGSRAVLCLGHARMLVALSSASRDFFARILPEALQAPVVIGGVDAATIAATSAHPRKRPYVFCASRLLLSNKAIDVLIAAFKIAAATFPDVDLLISGIGPDLGRIQELIAANALESRVRLLGLMTRERLHALYRGAAVFAMPSRGRGEGLGLVFLEAMAAGVPIIGTASGGPSEIIVDHFNGLLIEEEDVKGFAHALCALLSDPGARRKMGERGRSMVEAKYTWRRFAERYSEIYSDCLAGAPVRAGQPAQNS